MRSILIPAAIVASIAASGAFAATTTGAIKSIDAKALSITLADGSVYMLPKGFKLDALKVGEKVSVNWDKQGKDNVATEVKAAS